MSFITIIYLLLLLLGTVWVVYRVTHFLRSQREREAMWDQMMSPDEMRTYVENLKRESESKADDVQREADEKKIN